MVYDPITPIDNVFTAVQDLADMAAMAGVPYSVMQTVNMAYRVINNTRKFSSYISKWNRKPPMERNWMNFKTFFRAAHEELKETTDLTAQETPFQANVIKEIVQGIKDELLGTTNDNFYANYAHDTSTRDDDITTLQDEIASLKSTISSLQSSRRSVSTPPPMYIPTDTAQYTRANSTGRNNDETSTLSERTVRKKQFKYCWTHGYCGHDSKSCERKAQNHDDNATHNNRNGGSTKGYKRFNRNKHE